MPVLPATGSAISFGNAKRGYSNSLGSNIALRSTLGGYVGISSGSITLSSNFGGRTTPHNT